jgi:hypothetical protein
MGFSAATVATVSSVASMGLKAGSDVTAGVAKADQDFVTAQNYQLQGKTQATNYEYQGAEQEAQFELESGQLSEEAAANTVAAKAGKLQAALVDANARQTLTNQLTVMVTRAAGGDNPTSPTTAALLGYDTNVSNINRNAQETTINAQTAEEEAAAAYETASANFALVQGTNAEDVADANARVAAAFGTLNAGAAENAGDLALATGAFGAGSDILGGLVKALKPSSGSSPS